MSGCGALFFLAPEFLEARIAAAVEAVEFVADRILQIVILVVLLGFIEWPGRRDLGCDRLLEALRERLERLLAASDKVGNFMANPAVAPAVDPAATEALSASPDAVTVD